VSDNYFLEESPSPDQAAIKAALGERFSWYEGVLAAATGFTRDWKYYGKKYGWKLKVHDGNKALFELGIAKADIRIGMAVRERELQVLRDDGSLAAGLADFLAAEKSKEGWGIRVKVKDGTSYDLALDLIRAVADIRRKA
jgi:hypothetical protein